AAEPVWRDIEARQTTIPALVSLRRLFALCYLFIFNFGIALCNLSTAELVTFVSVRSTVLRFFMALTFSSPVSLIVVCHRRSEWRFGRPFRYASDLSVIFV